MKIKLRLGFLKRFLEFDRNVDKLNPIAGGSSKATCKAIESQLLSGKGIKKPVEFTVCKENMTGLLTDGNHRLTSCLNAGLSDNYEIPVSLKIIKEKSFVKKDRADKYRKI